MVNESKKFYRIGLVDFNLKLSDRFDIIGEIKRLIYTHDENEKFIYNEYLKKTQISPHWLHKTNQYNSLKKLAHKVSNKDTGSIDITLLNSFMEDIRIKMGIFNIQRKYGFESNEKNEDEVLNHAIAVFSTTRPNEIEDILIDDSAVLQEADLKVTNMLDKLK